MTPPKTSVAGKYAGPPDGSSAVSLCPQEVYLQSLRKRTDFLRAARARRQGTKGLVLQARKRGDNEPGESIIRYGITCSKKVGNAVTRNRAKRRLRALARDILPRAGVPGWDYVLIGRAEKTVGRPYMEMENDLRHALHKVHGTPT